MRRVLCIIALVVLLAACSKSIECQQAEIVVVNGCETFDLGWCRTVVQLENGSRVKIKEKWGEVGDTFTVAKYGNAWKPCEETVDE